MTRRSAIRVRLTRLYATTFFLAGALLIAFTYLYLTVSLDRQLADRVGSAEQLTADFLHKTSAHSGTGAGEFHEALRAQFQQDRDDTLRSMLVWSLVALGVVGVAAGGVGWLLAGRALHPLQRITATARGVADQSLDQRIALTGPDDEIKDLADTFDAMLERLDRAFDGQRRFVANASHELRTPLTINRTLIQVALDTPDAPESTRQLGTTLLEVNRRQERLIDGLLVLASSDTTLTQHDPVDLAAIARRAITVSGAAGAAGIEIRTSLATAPATGDPVLLEHLAHNLLDNAIRYNDTEHGWISVATGTTGDDAYLTVDNTGPTVPPDQVDGLFAPFHRLASSERLTDTEPNPPGRGAGLGLSIVHSVTHAHHGTIRAHPRPGGGLSIHIRIPRVPPGTSDPRSRPPE